MSSPRSLRGKQKQKQKTKKVTSSMSVVEKRQQREPAAEFFLMQHADGSDAMLLMGRDASGGSVCVRVPYERTLYLLPSGLASAARACV
jgi:hypothetical protein